MFECEHFSYGVNLHSLPPSNSSVEYLEHVKTAVYDNTKIIDSSQNWVELCFLESLHIKWKKPKLNCGVKATKELVKSWITCSFCFALWSTLPITVLQLIK